MRKKIAKALCLALSCSLVLGASGCGKSSDTKKNVKNTETKEEVTAPAREEETVAEVDFDGTEVPLNIQTEENIIDDKYRNYYEIFVASFYDSDGDGMGDLQGLIEKLDYINDGDPDTDTDLGCTGIWLMPISPSPSYHKYDVTDYKEIDEAYGTLDDYKELVEECHKRGINVIIDLVMNHSSVAHPWFKEAKEYLNNLPEGQEPNVADCKYIDYYTFTKEQVSSKYYAVGSSGYYYNGEFSQMMPDLNLENEDVRKEFEDIVDFWLDLGTDGFRLDAAKEYYSGDADRCVGVLDWFNSYVKSKDEDAYIVAETWTPDNERYVESGIDSAFDFGNSQNNGAIIMGARGTESYYGGQYVADTFESEMLALKDYSDSAIEATFIGNHDIDRVTPLLAYDEDAVKLAHGLLCMTNGCPFIYYGDEIGLGGTGADENKRSPMLWTSDEKAEGMTTGPINMNKTEVINKFDPVDVQSVDEYSILSYTKQAIKLRNIFPEIARGEIELLDDDIDDEFIMAMKKTYNDSQIIILANTSADEYKTVTLSREELGYTDIEGVLTVNSQMPKQKDDTIGLPPRSIVILK